MASHRLTTATRDEPAILTFERRHVLFTVEHTRFDFVRTLERRANGEELLLANRYQRHGLAGRVAIKRVRSPASAARRQRLVEEVQLAYRLHHPTIAQVHYFKVHRGKPYIIMEHVDGPSLETVLNLMAMRGKPVSLPFALHVAAELADALHHAHSLQDEQGRSLRLIHRDVSPRNVRVAHTGEVKLTHFGVAYSHLVGREETADALLKGDVAYASPEYLAGTTLTAASDLFSLGLVLLELATGRHLFAAAADSLEPPRAKTRELRLEEPPSLPLTQMLMLLEDHGPQDIERAAADLPDEVRAVLQGMLHKDAAKRFASAGALCTALRECLVQEIRRTGRPFGRADVAEELARLISDASAARDEVELLDEGLFPSGLEAHELPPRGQGGN
ncbi:serine/threonine-protein kinase [Corallococcus macrosporus]|uniref:Serine/threonine kinase family protein n=1 Tax=Myxococcus fulvus (strain ATCC BAA-855 / HW-1) TaxID=483219 RepID=F8CPB5_MYXFH|nr:serine/threonine-protein kinase [Corallococcus macrosporus]AEI67877.1 serine/threonine kinase family protein [Corallococcus macrosporus]